MLHAAIFRRFGGRVMAFFALKDILCVLGQDQSGIQRQVHAQGGVLKIAAFGTPTGTEPFPKKPQFRNHFARSGNSCLVALNTLSRLRRLTRWLTGAAIFVRFTRDGRRRGERLVD